MRVLLRLLAPVLGLALAAAGVLLAIEVIVGWTRPGEATGVLVPWPDWKSALEATTWADPAVLGTGFGIAVVGLLLVLLGLFARRSDITVIAPRADMTVTMSPRVLARLVGQRVRRSDDVASAAVTASKGRITVTATGWGDPDGEVGAALRSSVEGTVAALLDDVPLTRRPRVRVRLAELRGPR
ncbi:hypothetical protein SAMN05443637_10925 [Pseudonocardia thermophila]|uniref:DUF6286 domain-containing protein n=1 Tax=Pseudonocardia thermophila TaxID=1848 RepID=A0A1M6TYV3_PSETH|nr:DUF6286 domain-containing protein [Pseudonocardia thermophila]SHK61998.1 hypothetical protein SAMN05443637_10925 [Pseudonocardia thermophila]